MGVSVGFGSGGMTIQQLVIGLSLAASEEKWANQFVKGNQVKSVVDFVCECHLPNGQDSEAHRAFTFTKHPHSGFKHTMCC